MRKFSSIFFVSLLLITACGTKPHSTIPRGDQKDSLYSRFIPIDSANKMIGSYLKSLSDTDSSLQSLIVNVAQLTAYLNSANANGMTHLKLCFAHTLEYINAGNANQPAGYKSGALTLILVGYDSSGNYVYFNGNLVLEYLAPCPTSCPIGQAAQPYLTTN